MTKTYTIIGPEYGHCLKFVDDIMYNDKNGIGKIKWT